MSFAIDVGGDAAVAGAVFEMVGSFRWKRDTVAAGEVTVGCEEAVFGSPIGRGVSASSIPHEKRKGAVQWQT